MPLERDFEVGLHCIEGGRREGGREGRGGEGRGGEGRGGEGIKCDVFCDYSLLGSEEKTHW